jgi:hypothetical protein
VQVKCTGEKPRCQYCTTYQKHCVYEELVKRQRSVAILDVLLAITAMRPDTAYTDQRTLGLSGWKKNSASSKAQRQPHRRRQRKIPALPAQACNDPTQAHRAGTPPPFKGHGLLLLDLRHPVVHRRLIMGPRAQAMMVLSMREDLIGGSQLSGKRSCRIFCSRLQHVSVSCIRS